MSFNEFAWFLMLHYNHKSSESSSSLIHFLFFPHIVCVGFLFMILHLSRLRPASASSSAPSLSPQLCHHNFVTHHLSHTTLSHTFFQTQFFTRNFVTHSLSHTTLSHTHTQLCHTLSFTHNFVMHSLSHTTLSHTLPHTPSFTHTIFHMQLCHTLSFRTLSHTIFHTPSFTRNFVRHPLPHTTLSHTLFHT